MTRINPALDAGKLGKAFRRAGGRLQVRDFLAPDVLNFTRLWEPDWGGYLQFFNDQHDVELAWRPIFNALNLFTVPHDHSVEMVAPFAGGQRLAITGWLRTDEPPGPFGRLDT